MNTIHKWVASIQKVLRNKEFKYEIKLKPNYSFESTGTQIQYCYENEINEMLDEIVYCDGKGLEH